MRNCSISRELEFYRYVRVTSGHQLHVNIYIYVHKHGWQGTLINPWLTKRVTTIEPLQSHKGHFLHGSKVLCLMWSMNKSGFDQPLSNTLNIHIINCRQKNNIYIYIYKIYYRQPLIWFSNKIKQQVTYTLQHNPKLSTDNHITDKQSK